MQRLARPVGVVLAVALAALALAAPLATARAASAIAGTSTSTTTVAFDASTNAPWSGTETTGSSAYDTATVTSSGTITATGTVSYTFFTNGTCAGTGTSAGTVSLTGTGAVPNSSTQSALAAGSYSFQATYSGDLNYSGSTGACEPFTVAGKTDWAAYLAGPLHSSFNGPDHAITPANVATLTKAWHFVGDPATMPGQPGPGYFASPTVADGAVFIGSMTGWFYKLDATTGAVLDKVFLGFQPKLSCSALGIVATATAAVDPSDHQPVVYVGAPDGYLYALNAADLSVRWKSVIALPSTTNNDYFQWSSPTVANGKVYVGIASNCDTPLVRGGVASYDQVTGTHLATFFTVPNGVVGGSVWSTVAVDSQGYVYATTGNPVTKSSTPDYTEAIVKLDGNTLAPVGFFGVPESARTGDGDFGGSPTIFTATIGTTPTPMVGACNKNGIYYAVNRATMKLAWQKRIGAKSSSSTPAQCTAAAVYNGTSLYMAGPATTIGGFSYRGSIMKINPATGGFQWHTGLPNGVIGSPGMGGGGVLTVGTFDNSTTPNAEYLVSATGKILRTLYTGNRDFAQGVFADGWLYTANGTGVYGWKP